MMMRPRIQSGFSLIELMIAITLGLGLLLVLTQLMSEQSLSRAEIEKSGRQIENGRYAMSLLQEDIQHAGYFGQNAGVSAVLGALPNPCEAGTTTASVANIRTSLSAPVQVYNNPTTLPTDLAGCLDGGNHVDGTDIIVVRHASTNDGDLLTTTTTTIPTTVTNRLYIQSTPAQMILGAGGTGAATTFTLKKKDGNTAADLWRYVVRIYFISPCNVPASGTVCGATADNGRPIPTLKRMDLVDGAFVTTPLVEGIDNLQIDYGIDTDSIPDGSPDTFKVAPTVAELANLVAVRVNLLARATEPSPGQTDNRSYALGLTSVTAPGDHYKRQAYSVLIRLINVIGRLEK